jgi:HlyD family secretion protein
VTEKLHASVDVPERTVVVAPVGGTVVDVKFKTIGGVVQRGEPIMSIVPSSDELIIEAHVTQVDRKAVHSGPSASIRRSSSPPRRRGRGSVACATANTPTPPRLRAALVLSEPHIRRGLRLAFLAHDIVEAIIEGRRSATPRNGRPLR